MLNHKFRNEWLDKLKLDPYHVYLKSLRLEMGLNRAELSAQIGLSPHTIRKYESAWPGKSKPPAWYEILLRLLCADLSIFGQAWSDSRIFRHDQKLSSPYFKHTRMSPLDMNSQYSLVHRQLEQQIRALSAELSAITTKYNTLSAEHQILVTRFTELNEIKSRMKAHETGLKTGKVLNLFKSN
ncbi:hypothetical protein CYQ88_10795 [Hydrogenovibrio sp. SC-1]|uniref:helix-turn-helix domain-containing protein n=1 Tax=Hydrogenovibrio sp. SC-1 TaxID=2065820 RepID=UPI000C7C7137|nr:helix-turn-helix transcriptional regulator [Hydrogenovibrio sp. SC-1]PLA73502.1 hypothetical protein CYQ88_10795 [Hydrogenovibrio sp. SC-1]